MELKLHEDPAPATVYSTGFSVDNMSWWFWIKAGMGFTLGAGLISVVSIVLYTLFWVNIILYFASGGRHR